MSDVQKVSLSFLESNGTCIASIEQLIRTIMDITESDVFLQLLPDIKNKIVGLDTKISVDKMRLNNLVYAYKQQNIMMKARFDGYRASVSNRLESTLPLNTNGSMYDPERLLSEKYYEGAIHEESRYSVMDVIKRLMSDEEENLIRMDADINKLNEVYKHYIEASSRILSVKTRLNDESTVTKFTTGIMTTDARQELEDLNLQLRNIKSSLTLAKQTIAHTFQKAEAQEVDYEIYHEAVKRFNAMTLEATFQSGSITDIY